MLGKIEGRRRPGQQRMRWHHQFNGLEFGQAPEDGEGQGSLVCCRPWGRKESDATEQLRSSNRGAEMSGNLRSPRLGGSERDSPGPKLRMGAAGLKAAEGQADI